MDVFRNVLVFLWLAVLGKRIKAIPCLIGQEPDPQSRNRYRWVIPEPDPCLCTVVQVGGYVTRTPYRPFNVTYYDTFLHSNDPDEIQQWLKCPVGRRCSQGEPLGMEDGSIPDASITASSFFGSDEAVCSPRRARPHTSGYAAAWCAGVLDSSPWIQVDLGTKVYFTGLITYGRRSSPDDPYYQRVTKYNVEYSDDGQSWDDVTDADGTAYQFTGNSDRDTAVTALFPRVVHARFLRILPTAWYEHISMRFEVLGCSK